MAQQVVSGDSATNQSEPQSQSQQQQAISSTTREHQQQQQQQQETNNNLDSASNDVRTRGKAITQAPQKNAINNNNNNNTNTNTNNNNSDKHQHADQTAERANFTTQSSITQPSSNSSTASEDRQSSADCAQDKCQMFGREKEEGNASATSSTLHTVIECGLGTSDAKTTKEEVEVEIAREKAKFNGQLALATTAQKELLEQNLSSSAASAPNEAKGADAKKRTSVSQESSVEKQTVTVNTDKDSENNNSPNKLEHQLKEKVENIAVSENKSHKQGEDEKTCIQINQNQIHKHQHIQSQKKPQDQHQANHTKKQRNSNLLINSIPNHSLDSSSSSSSDNSFRKTKCRRLSYLQSLLLRKWPCLALTICIMSSLLFGILLSALTVYLMHGFTDCSHLALAAKEPLLHGRLHLNSPPHELLRANRPSSIDFDTPLELHGGGGASSSQMSSGGHSSNHFEGRLLASAPSPGGADQSAAPVSASTTAQFQRLPGTIWPIHYDLFVQPYIAEPFNFSGRVSIRIKCTEPTDNITLHTLDLSLNDKSLSLKLADAGGNESVIAASVAQSSLVPKVTGLSEDKQLQYSIIKLDSKLEPGREYILGIDFVGSLNDDLAGFYKIKYERQNSGGETTWIAATQFQATDARRAFPCFDEPHYKATFSIQIKHWKNMTALSNMPITERKDSPDGLWVTDTFAKTHRMSTYLIAYAVTNFESRSEGNISVWTRPGFVHTAEYALKIAGKILRHYEDFFGIEYPLPKMDMIALPDFNAGAMENWGLITYRETAMLYDENSSSIANKQRVAVVVAHELAHQWFGNLVTPKWWDDLWLNEGFASYVEYIGVDHVEPNWRMLDQFVIEEVQNVFKMDALSSSHQISIPVNNPDEISEIFDHISYAKGASIIRMMSNFLTEDVFKLGLRRYLRALRYSNANQSDLWAHLTEAQKLVEAARTNTTSAVMRLDGDQSPVNVERVMNSWTLQTGYPLVTLKRQYEDSSKQQKASALLEQARYEPYKLQLEANKTGDQAAVLALTTTSASAQKWEIPITFTWKSEQNWEPRTRLWLHQNDSKPYQLKGEQLVPSSNDQWMLLNINQVGYYRVNYDQRNWQLLIEQLHEDHHKIGTTNRAQILDDIFELARSGVIDYKFALESTKYLKSERDYLPWDTVLMSFSYIDDMLQRTPLYGEWRDYIADLIEPYYARYKNFDWLTTPKSLQPQASSINKLLSTSSSLRNSSNNAELSPANNETGWLDSNDVLEHYNHVNSVSWACTVNEHCMTKAKSTFQQWKKSGINRINPALRFTVYCSAIENGKKEDWEFLWKKYEVEQNASERDRILRALGCTKEIWLLSRYLEWTFNKSKPIRRQDGAFVFRMIAKNNYGRDVAFNFMRERWSTIKEYYGKTSFSLGNLIRSVATSMNTQVELNQLVNFYESIKNDVGTGKRSFQIAIEEVESNVLWRNRNYKILENWIHEERSKATATAPSLSSVAAAAA